MVQDGDLRRNQEYSAFNYNNTQRKPLHNFNRTAQQPLVSREYDNYLSLDRLGENKVKPRRLNSPIFDSSEAVAAQRQNKLYSQDMYRNFLDSQVTDKLQRNQNLLKGPEVIV